ncbi:polysaccharide deacetylase family protein [Microtetraspora niveoalba]|uniref:polysaccharide deacetylase family protein n=1 Tax=Microtetraspora niveoalba TaxID=46175 RepID=UPI000830015D|nr:polysaccharide deacetylase family protein [Microtetraspora niveoalba]
MRRTLWAPLALSVLVPLVFQAQAAHAVTGAASGGTGVAAVATPEAGSVRAGSTHGTTAAPAAKPRPKATPKSRTRPRTVVALTFDDGDRSHTMAAKLLERHGLRGTFYINSGDLGTKGKLTRAQAAAIAKAGHEIGGHTVNHERLTDLAPEEQTETICADRRALLGMGLTVRTFAYPYGAVDASARQAARDCGYNAARTIGGIAQGPCRDCVVAEPTRPERVYEIRTPGSVRESTTLADMKRYVLRAEQSGGGLLPLAFHKVCARGCGTFSVRTAVLDQFLGWLAKRERHGTAVRTLADVTGGRVRPVPEEPAAL